ncbi:MAG TPA: site-2 protease family protein [Vicinamibacteria bacterium]|nr:site-2 protease family protein [Vicinamibacteria bacterium]
MDLSSYQLAIGLTSFVVLLFSLSFHEAAHAWMASRLGDETARREGRISLNPLVHIDPVGTLLFPLLQIFTGVALLGWAKPTPYEPRNFDRRHSMRVGHMLVAGAGPLSNLVLALVFTAVLFAIVRSGLAETPEHPLVMLVAVAVPMNVGLALFNLIPIPPLDGSKVASYGLPGRLGDRYDRVMEPYGFLILLGVCMLPLFGGRSLMALVLSPFTAWFATLLFRLAGA